MPAPRNKNKPRSHCAVCYSLDLVGDRWTLLVLRDLIVFRKRHFRELASDESIASNILTSRLKQLERGGILTRRPDPDSGRQIIYEPTSKGLDLLPVILELVRWGAAHDPETSAPRELVARIKRDRAGLIEELRTAHRRPARR